MNGLFRLGWACVAVTLGSVGTGAYGLDDVNDYSIRMTRAMEVGQQFSVRAKGIQQSGLRDLAERTEDMDQRVLAVTLEGTAKVLEIDAHGRPTALEYTVSTCTMDENGHATTIAPAGAKLTARDRKGVTVWQINGRPASDDVNEALRMFGLATGDQTVDQMLGTDRPRSVGESWAIDSKSVAKAMERELHTTVDAHNVAGASTLVDAVDHAGTPCTVVYTHVSADDCPPPAGTVDGFQVRNSSATATFQGIFPRDMRLPALSNAWTTVAKATVVDNAGIERELNWSRYVEFETTFASSIGHVATGAEVEIVDE